MLPVRVTAHLDEIGVGAVGDGHGEQAEENPHERPPPCVGDGPDREDNEEEDDHVAEGVGEGYDTSSGGKVGVAP